MLWRTTYDTGSIAKALSALVERLEAAAARSTRQVGDSPPLLRVAFARARSRSVAAEALMAALRFNGKSALDNDQLYREFTFDAANERAQYADVAARVAAFQPHVLVFAADGELLEDVERAWPSGLARRPYYVTETAIDPEIVAFLAKAPERRQRLFSVTSTSSTPPNARFVLHYNETFPEPITRTFAPNASYDAFYVAAYATFATDSETVDGPAIARSIRRLVPLTGNPGGRRRLGHPGRPRRSPAGRFHRPPRRRRVARLRSEDRRRAGRLRDHVRGSRCARGRLREC